MIGWGVSVSVPGVGDFRGTVSCLDVTGNVAMVGIDIGENSLFPGPDDPVYEVVDNGRGPGTTCCEGRSCQPRLSARPIRSRDWSSRERCSRWVTTWFKRGSRRRMVPPVRRHSGARAPSPRLAREWRRTAHRGADRSWGELLGGALQDSRCGLMWSGSVGRRRWDVLERQEHHRPALGAVVRVRLGRARLLDVPASLLTRHDVMLALAHRLLLPTTRCRRLRVCLLMSQLRNRAASDLLRNNPSPLNGVERRRKEGRDGGRRQRATAGDLRARTSAR